MTEREELKRLLEINPDFRTLPLYIWGTGNTSDLYQEGLKRLENEGYIINGYFDNNASKRGTEYCGKNVCSPDDINDIGNALFLIASPTPATIHQIGKQLDEKGVLWMGIDSFVVKTHACEVLSVYDSLEDSRSRTIYYELIKIRVLGNVVPEHIVDGNQYFFMDFGNASPKEVFVDCGAYVGDSFERYLWNRAGVFNKAMLFEPDKKNIKAIEKRLNRLKEEWNISDDKVLIYPYGIGDSDSVSYLEKNESLNGLSSKLVTGNINDTEEIRVVSLDSFLEDQDTLFIKADIESYEYKMILGLKKTIQKKKPKLAVCIYHNSVDFYSIPLLLKELNPDYRFSVRHYTSNFSETVLYAY